MAGREATRRVAEQLLATRPEKISPTISESSEVVQKLPRRGFGSRDVTEIRPTFSKHWSDFGQGRQTSGPNRPALAGCGAECRLPVRRRGGRLPGHTARNFPLTSLPSSNSPRQPTSQRMRMAMNACVGENTVLEAPCSKHRVACVAWCGFSLKPYKRQPLLSPRPAFRCCGWEHADTHSDTDTDGDTDKKRHRRSPSEESRLDLQPLAHVRPRWLRRRRRRHFARRARALAVMADGMAGAPLAAAVFAPLWPAAGGPHVAPLPDTNSWPPDGPQHAPPRHRRLLHGGLQGGQGNRSTTGRRQTKMFAIARAHAPH